MVRLISMVIVIPIHLRQATKPAIALGKGIDSPTNKAIREVVSGMAKAWKPQKSVTAPGAEG